MKERESLSRNSEISNLSSRISKLESLVKKLSNPVETIKVNTVLSDNAKLPVYSHADDSGCDLYTTSDTLIDSSKPRLIKTGVHLQLPEGYEVTVRGRSGINLKTVVDTKLGTIDSNYTGDIGIVVYLNETSDNSGKVNTLTDHNRELTVGEDRRMNNLLSDASFTTFSSDNSIGKSFLFIPKDTRIAQIVCSKVVHMNFNQVDKLDSSTRGANGFGSTGI